MNSSSVIELLDCAVATGWHPSKLPARSKTAREFLSNRCPFQCFPIVTAAESGSFSEWPSQESQKLYTKQSQGAPDAFGCHWSRMAPPPPLLPPSLRRNLSRLGAARPTIPEA